MRKTEDRIFEKLDENLERRILNFLWQRHVPSLQNVAVEVHKGSVILQGTVASFYEKQLCISCCQRVAGVLKIIDDIKVSSPKVKR